MWAVDEIRQLLSDNGLPKRRSLSRSIAAGDPHAPVRVSYLRYVAEGPVCGAWPTNLAFEPNNLPYPNFGCTNQHNLAAMVANPADLLGPRTESDRPSERRDVMWDKYVKGESTGPRSRRTKSRSEGDGFREHVVVKHFQIRPMTSGPEV